MFTTLNFINSFDLWMKPYMLSRYSEPDPVSSQTSLTSSSPTSTQLALPEQAPRKIVFFDADISEKDINATVRELNRLQNTGYELIAYTTNQNILKMLARNNPYLELTDEEDLEDIIEEADQDHEKTLASEAQINLANFISNLTLIPINDREFDSDNYLESLFIALIAHCVGHDENRGRWFTVDGYLLSKHATQHDKFNLKKFQSRMGKPDMVTPIDDYPPDNHTVEWSSSISGSTTETRVELKNRVEKLVAILKDPDRPYQAMSSAIAHVESTLPKRITLMLTDNDFIAREPKMSAKISLYSIAALITVLTIVTAFLSLPLMLASCVSTAVGLVSFTISKLLDIRYGLSESESINQGPEFDNSSEDESELKEELDARSTKNIYKLLIQENDSSDEEEKVEEEEEEEEEENIIEIDTAALASADDLQPTSENDETPTIIRPKPGRSN